MGRRLPSSRLHSKLEPGSFEENVNVALRPSIRPDAPAPAVVSGGVVSNCGARFAKSGPQKVPLATLPNHATP